MTDDARTPPRLLLIDDDAGQLGELRKEIEKLLAGGRTVDIDVWQPAKGEVIRDKLVEKLNVRPTLVVTDHDLTEGGPAGMMGGSVISWCRAHAIPVGDYSRKLQDELEEPELFDFRFPSEPDAAAVFIVDILNGFDDLAHALATRDPATDADSWSLTLATLLGREGAASSFSLYSVRTGASHAGIIERLTNQLEEAEARRLLATYVLGHLLYNGILRYPGPILSDLALCSYLAVADERVNTVAGLFEVARYQGPFGSGLRFFWQEDVDDALLSMAEEAVSRERRSGRRGVPSRGTGEAPRPRPARMRPLRRRAGRLPVPLHQPHRVRPARVLCAHEQLDPAGGISHQGRSGLLRALVAIARPVRWTSAGQSRHCASNSGWPGAR